MTEHTICFIPPNSPHSSRTPQMTHCAYTALLLAAALGITPFAHAQTRAEPTLAPVVITAPAAKQQASITGFSDTPLHNTPISATVVDARDIQAVGAQRLSDLYKFDASISDAYNAVGYIDYANVRGFRIDNKFNYRRDGLPISGDTAIGLANKERIEILKGTSGIQAGTSAPGGLVNYMVKRPPHKPIRSIGVTVDGNGQIGAAVDLGGRFGADDAQGYRLNLAADRLRGAAPNTRGHRQQIALALQSRVGKDALLEAEFEWSQQSQSNVPGLSILGNAGTLPAADATLNLNRQSWSQPSVFKGLTGSLRYQQAINDQWQWTAQLGSQRLKTDDRIAFPFGCTDGNGLDYYADRFCPNASADLYDFRSEGEQRRKQAAQIKLDGQFQLGTVTHSLTAGLLRATSLIALPDSAFNPSGNISLAYPTEALAAAPQTLSPGSTNRETTQEFFATDMISWTPQIKTWLGLRHTQLQRSSSVATGPYQQHFVSPWLSLSYQHAQTTFYASHGHGIESEQVAAQNTLNPGAVLPLARSRQSEVGLKHAGPSLSWQASLFHIVRPMSSVDACSFAAINPCWVQADGQSTHQGLELLAAKQWSAWQLSASATWLHARRSGSSQTQINGLRPSNVPSHILRLNASYALTANLHISAHLSHEGQRAILPSNALWLPAWTRLDSQLKWDSTLNGIKSTWQIGIDNLLDKRYFQESPNQFGHIYLFPAQPRTLRLTLLMSL